MLSRRTDLNDEAAKDDTKYQSDKVALCVTAHTPYLKYLPELLEQWEKLLKGLDWEKYLCLDGCDYTPPEGWNVLKFNAGHPSVLRNGAVDAAKRGWIFFWDADNRPSSAAVNEIEKIRKNIHDGVGCFYTYVNNAVQDHQDIRTRPYIDTASLWRVEAIKHVGGWSDQAGVVEDWELALRIKRTGWSLLPLGASIEWRSTEENRSKLDREEYKNSIIYSKSLCIASPHRGSKKLSFLWFKALKNHKFNINYKELIFIDKSGNSEFKLWAQEKLSSLDFDKVSYVVSPPVASESFDDVHNSIGSAYSNAINSTSCDVVLTWEDDVIPEDKNAFTNLSYRIKPLSLNSVAAAVVPLRDNQSIAIASLRRDRWGTMPTMKYLEEYKHSIVPMGMVGGGFTLWHKSALEKCPILGMYYLPDGFNLGWDGWVCRRLNENGYKICVVRDIKCTHLNER